MLMLAADENFNNNIVRGLLRRKPDLDIIRIQDVDLSGADDPTILEWAAKEGRVLFTHDVSTITHYADERVSPDFSPAFRACPEPAEGRSEAAEMTLHARLATEDPADVSSAIRRGG